MQKLIRICAIAAGALIALTLLLLIVSIPLQRPIARVMGAPEEVLGILPRLPWFPILFCMLRLGCIIPLILTDNKKGTIVLEVALFVCMAVALPGLNSLWSFYAPVVANTKGLLYLNANSVVNTIVGMCTIPSGLGQALAYGVCGMRLVSKRLHRQETLER